MSLEDLRSMFQEQQWEREGRYDVAQICPNGHVINPQALAHPEVNKQFCDQCGEQTLTACESCQKPIQGLHYTRGFNYRYYTPRFCHNCGSMFPWTKLRLEAARDLIEELRLSEEEKITMQQSLEHMVKDTPRTEVAASRFKRLLKQGGAEMGGMFRDILVDVLSETAKKVLFPS